MKAMSDLKKLIREVPDFPKPGILFYDITTLLKDPAGLAGVIDGLKAHYQHLKVDVVLGIAAGGFIFAPALAYALGAGFGALAKLNLDLRVRGGRPDSFPELGTIFQTISLADTLDIAFPPARRTSVELEDPLAIPDNLIVRAAHAALTAMRVTGRVAM